MRKNILFFILAIALSLVTASYFGSWYDKLSPQYGGWLTDKTEAVSFAGFFVAYVFFIPFLFELFRVEKRKKLITWFLVFPLILWLAADLYHIYIPAVVGLAGFVLGRLINFIIYKFK